MELKIEYLPIKALKPYEKNTRKHQKKDVDNIARSIEKFGMNDPIGLWEDNIIVEGHGRMLACKQLGMTEVPCVRLDHLTDEQIASNMGIATSTLYNWKNEHLEILEALKKGKEVVDIQVENALLKRALGYTYKETTRECDEDGELKVTKVVTKEVVPDATAQIFWLKNRRPDLWRDKQNIEHSGQINNPFADLSTEELRKLADAE